MSAGETLPAAGWPLPLRAAWRHLLPHRNTPRRRPLPTLPIFNAPSQGCCFSEPAVVPASQPVRSAYYAGPAQPVYPAAAACAPPPPPPPAAYSYGYAAPPPAYPYPPQQGVDAIVCHEAVCRLVLHAQPFTGCCPVLLAGGSLTRCLPQAKQPSIPLPSPLSAVTYIQQDRGMDTGTAALMGGAAGLMTGVLLAEATQPHYGWYGPACGPTVIGAWGLGIGWLCGV